MAGYFARDPGSAAGPLGPRPDDVEPAELEAAIRRMPEVRDAVALLPDSPAGRQLIAYVVPEPSATQPSVAEAEQGAAKRVSNWRVYYDRILYDDLLAWPAANDPWLNSQGWRSSYDERPIPEAHIREQVDRTAERIMAGRPRRVLEIGCGTGMLLFRIAPHCERYVGTDFSATALDYVQGQLEELSTDCRITLRQLEAADLDPLGDEQFDAVVLNSTVQYFPTSDYLQTVLAGVIDRVADGGVVFVGDVRSRSGLPLFHASVLLAQAEQSTSLHQVRHEVSRRVAEERELCIDPDFFRSAPLPRVAGLRLDAKHGEPIEMTLFRYDARIYVGRPGDWTAPTVSWEWGSEVGDVAGLEAALDANRSAVVECRAIPDPRCATERLVLSPESSQLNTVADLAAWLDRQGRTGREPAPGQLRAIADARGLQVQLAPSTDRPGHWDAAFYPGPAGSAYPASASPADWRRYANDPLADERRRKLATAVLEHLRSSVPRYLVPSRVIVLDELPLTSGGELDVARLPPPRDPFGSRRS